MKTIPLKDIMDKCKKSKKKIKVSDVAEIAETCLGLLYNQGTILKRVEKKIGEEDWNILVTSCLSTLFGTIYANTEGKFKTEADAINYGKSIGATGVAIKHKNGGKNS